MVSKISKTLTSAKFRLAAIKLGIIACTVAMTLCNGAIAFAANDDNTAPDGLAGTATMNKMITVVFWIVRILVLFIGGVPGIPKIVQGQADENPRDRNAGLAVIGVTGAAFAATFVVEALVKA